MDVNKLDNGHYTGSGSEPKLLQIAERDFNKVCSVFIDFLPHGIIHITWKAHCLLNTYYCSVMLGFGRKESGVCVQRVAYNPA